MIGNYKNYTPEVDDSCFIAPGCAILGNVKIGKNSSVWFNAVLRGDMDAVIVGENTNIQDCCVLHCVTGVETRLGNNITVGHGAILHSCTIGDNSLVGMGAVVLDRAKIGRNCLIAAGAVVVPCMEVPDGSLVMGSPARIKRRLTEEEIARIRESTEEYIKYAGYYRMRL